MNQNETHKLQVQSSSTDLSLEAFAIEELEDRLELLLLSNTNCDCDVKENA